MQNYKIMECGTYVYHGCGIHIELELSSNGYSTNRSIKLPLDRKTIIDLMRLVGVDYENGMYLHELKDEAIRVDDSENKIILYNLFDDDKYLEIKLP